MNELPNWPRVDPDECLRRIRAALVEVGYPPDAVRLVDGCAFYRPGDIPARVAWRAMEATLMLPPLCFTCFSLGDPATRQWHCKATAQFIDDCGAHRS